MAIITYKELQNRIDYLQQLEFMVPNAFYPTRFVRAGNVNEIYAHNKWNGIIKNNANGVNTIASMVEMEGELKEIGSDILSDPRDLALLESISGNILKFMKTPYTSNGGVLDTGVTKELNLSKDDRSVKLKFKVQNNLAVYRDLLTWKENWTSSDLDYRYLRKRENGYAVQEGYLGMSYINVNHDGNINYYAHLALFGLIPKEIDFESSIGPSTSVKNTTLNLTCTVASGLLMIRSTKEAVSDTNSKPTEGSTKETTSDDNSKSTERSTSKNESYKVFTLA